MSNRHASMSYSPHSAIFLHNRPRPSTPQEALDDKSGAKNGHVPPSAQQLALQLRTSLEEGIDGSADDVAARQAAFGANTVPQAQSATFLELLLDAFQARSNWVELSQSRTVARAALYVPQIIVDTH